MTENPQNQVLAQWPIPTGFVVQILTVKRPDSGLVTPMTDIMCFPSPNPSATKGRRHAFLADFGQS
jgi:hypothetical protein